jgi:single-stranded DNA-binding protein
MMRECVSQILNLTVIPRLDRGISLCSIKVFKGEQYNHHKRFPAFAGNDRIEALKKTIRFFSFMILFALAAIQVHAQKPADDYFHSGAGLFIEGRHQQAVIEVEEGIRNYPDDAKLNMLNGHLKQLQDQQQQDNQQDRNDQEEEQDQEDQQDQEQQEQEEQESGEEPEEEQDTTASAEESEEPPPGEMSEEDAKRLLDSYKEEEKEDQERMRQRKQKKVKIDW